MLPAQKVLIVHKNKAGRFGESFPFFGKIIEYKFSLAHSADGTEYMAKKWPKIYEAQKPYFAGYVGMIEYFVSGFPFCKKAVAQRYYPKGATGGLGIEKLGYYLEAIAIDDLKKRHWVRKVSTGSYHGGDTNGCRIGQLGKVGLGMDEERIKAKAGKWLEALGRGVKLAAGNLKLYEYADGSLNYGNKPHNA